MLEMIGVTEDQFREAVAQAKTDDDVAAWLRAHANTEKYPEFNDRILNRRVADIKARDPEGFAKRYPVSTTRPDIEYMVDMLEADDKDMFR